jgi:hypothetical protein
VAGVVAAVLLQAPDVTAQGSQEAGVRSSEVGRVDVAQTAGSLIGIQYEQWFYGPESWETSEAVPLLGKYTTDEPTVMKHYEAFHDLGVDWLLIDWSNMLWSKPAWEEHAGDTKKLEDKTSVLFETALHLHQRGKYAPKLVIMLGLQNGPPVPNGVERLNGELAWLKTNYLDRPEYKDLWLYDGGKPLLVVLYWPPDPCAQLSKDLAQTKLKDGDWTIRWMSSQLQDNHAERCGMWSWMDGVIPQILTKRDGNAEDIVVTPSSFQLPGRGWTDSSAIARDHGVPYLMSWKAAFESRPKFIQVHQWNEFEGQADGHGLPDNYWGLADFKVPAKLPTAVFADEYNVQLSDDIEPTDLHACTFRGCGGWGYYYYNLTRAIISLYRGESPDITVLALSGPTTKVDGAEKSVDLQWTFLGKAPSGYSLSVDGQVVQHSLKGTSYALDVEHLRVGQHTVTLIAAGVHTYFSLDPTQAAVRSHQALPVVSEIKLEVGAR